MARIARADDTDNTVSFNNLAELTSALNRRSDFHVLSPFFHKIAKHAAVSPSPNPDGILYRRATRIGGKLHDAPFSTLLT